MGEGRNSLKISTPVPFRPDPSRWTVPLKIIMPHVCSFRLPILTEYCAANFSFAQLAKRKSLGRSKPATNSQAQASQHTVWNVSTISKPY